MALVGGTGAANAAQAQTTTPGGGTGNFEAILARLQAAAEQRAERNARTEEQREVNGSLKDASTRVSS